MTAPKLYFENDIATISEHPDGYVFFACRPGKRTAAQLQEALRHTASLLQARGWHRVLNDQRLLAPFTPEETAQALAFWQQRTRLLGHGVYLASVLANTIFARIAATSWREQLHEVGLRYALFENEETASAWLRLQVVPPAPAIDGQPIAGVE